MIVFLYFCLNYLTCKLHLWGPILCLGLCKFLRPPWLFDISCYYLVKGLIPGQNVLHVKCAFSFPLQFFLKLLQPKENSATYNLCKGSDILSNFKQNLICSTDLSRIPEYKISRKSLKEVGAFLQADGRTCRS
jgi:hypothetical protein